MNWNEAKNELDRTQHAQIPENNLITPKSVNKISSSCLVCFATCLKKRACALFKGKLDFFVQTRQSGSQVGGHGLPLGS